MKLLTVGSLLFFWTSVLLVAQVPTVKTLFETKSAANGVSVVLGAKTFGPYEKVIRFVASSDGNQVAVLLQKKGQLVVLADGKESAPLAAGLIAIDLQVSDDGKVWGAQLGNDSGAQLVVVNGISYGPFEDVSYLKIAKGSWLLSARLAADSYKAWVTGKEFGSFQDLPFSILSPDGQFWAFVAVSAEGMTSFFTTDKTWKNIQYANTEALVFNRPIWGYKVALGEDQEIYVINGKAFEGYFFSGPLLVSSDGRHWGFAAMKHDGNGEGRVVVVDGREYPGEDLNLIRLAASEYFQWNSQRGSRTDWNSLSLR